jgi:hypothetical protein
MGRPSGIYNGDSDSIIEGYEKYIDSLPKSCDSIEQIIEYLNNKYKRGGLSSAEDGVLTYAESKLKPIGGGRRSQKRPTARRLRRRSSKRKARKARATRRK